MPGDKQDPPTDIGIFGDLMENEDAILQSILDLEDGVDCRLYINSPGGSPYTALGIVALLRHKRLRPTAVALGECMSAATLIFAAAQRRLATPHTIFLFHPLRWQSREDADHAEARAWAAEFERLEQESDALLASFLGLPRETVHDWTGNHRYLTGAQLAEQGVCELYALDACPPPRRERA